MTTLTTYYNPRPPLLEVTAEAWMDTKALMSAVDTAIRLLDGRSSAVQRRDLRDLLSERSLPVRAMLDRQEVRALRYARRVNDDVCELSGGGRLQRTGGA